MKTTRDIALGKMRERARELKCLYSVNELLSGNNDPLERVLGDLVTLIPMGWQHTTCCECLIVFEGKEFFTEDLKKTRWYQKADLVIDDTYAGEIRVYYTINVNNLDDPFLPEEQKLLNNIAQRVSQFIFQMRLRSSVKYLQHNAPHKSSNGNSLLDQPSDEYWRWRTTMVEEIADAIDMELYGIVAIYLIGSTKEATAGPESDIDLMMHFRGSAEQRKLLEAWINGWGQSLAIINYQKTGYRVKGSLIDLHIITDDDIKNKDSYAVMIGAKENSARLIKSAVK